MKQPQKNSPEGIFFSDWEYVVNYLKAIKSDKIALVCNSVIHEVYSYGTDETIAEFWERVNDPIFRWISIRDMMITDDPTPKFTATDVEAVRAFSDASCLKKFESIWGPIDQKENFVHWLLKYRYKVNWTREVRENYLPIRFLDLDKVKAEHIYFDRFTLDFLRRKVKEDFGINLKEETHFKAIFERRKNQ